MYDTTLRLEWGIEKGKMRTLTTPEIASTDGGGPQPNVGRLFPRISSFHSFFCVLPIVRTAVTQSCATCAINSSGFPPAVCSERAAPSSRGAHTCAAPSTTDGGRGLEASHYGPSAPREQSASDNHARPTIARPWPATNYSDRRRGANYPSARWASCQRGARFAPRAVARAAAGLGPTGLEPRRIPRSARLLQQARDARQAHGRPVQAGSCGARGQQQAELEHEPPTTSSSRDEHVPADQVDRPLAGRVARAGSRWHRDRHAGDRQSHVVPLLLADGH